MADEYNMRRDDIAAPHCKRRADVDDAIAWHSGDAVATVETLLDDCRHLRQQLALARAAISRGYTRGWVPSEDRP